MMNTKDLEWIIVRPTRLTNSQGKKYRVELIHSPPNGDKISRVDVANFMLKQVQKYTYLYKFPAFAY